MSEDLTDDELMQQARQHLIDTLNNPAAFPELPDDYLEDRRATVQLSLTVHAETAREAVDTVIDSIARRGMSGLMFLVIDQQSGDFWTVRDSQVIDSEELERLRAEQAEEGERNE